MWAVKWQMQILDEHPLECWGGREAGILGQREQKSNWLKIVFGHIQLSVAKKKNPKNFF